VPRVHGNKNGGSEGRDEDDYDDGTASSEDADGQEELECHAFTESNGLCVEVCGGECNCGVYEGQHTFSSLYGSCDEFDAWGSGDCSAASLQTDPIIQGCMSLAILVLMLGELAPTRQRATCQAGTPNLPLATNPAPHTS